MKACFEWDENKKQSNVSKHHVDFYSAQKAFKDKRRIIAKDLKHSQKEKRYFCFGKVGRGILTVSFTYRKQRIRIISAGYWRQGKQIYEKENQIL